MPITPKFCQRYDMSGRVTEVGSLSARAKMAIKFLSNSYLTIFVTNELFLRVIANLTQYNMYYILCKGRVKIIKMEI